VLHVCWLSSAYTRSANPSRHCLNPSRLVGAVESWLEGAETPPMCPGRTPFRTTRAISTPRIPDASRRCRQSKTRSLPVTSLIGRFGWRCLRRCCFGASQGQSWGQHPGHLGGMFIGDCLLSGTPPGDDQRLRLAGDRICFHVLSYGTSREGAHGRPTCSGQS
jgi:hypothetical protein